MKHSYPLFITLFFFAAAAPAVGDDDVTMQVVDDTRGVETIVRALRDARSAAVREEEKTPNRARGQTRADNLHTERDSSARATERLTAILDREEESEGDIEDFDVPEDLEIPEPVEE